MSLKKQLSLSVSALLAFFVLIGIYDRIQRPASPPTVTVAAHPPMTDGSVTLPNTPAVAPPVPTGPCGKGDNLDCPTARDLEAELLQETLWKQGREISVKAKGRRLVFEYALAGNAFAYNFRNDFVTPVAATLKGMGFTKVVLTDGNEDSWEWKLDR